MSKKYDSDLMRDRWRHIERMQAKGLRTAKVKKKDEGFRGPKFDMIVMDEMSKSFAEMAARLSTFGESSDATRRRLSNLALELDRMNAEHKAQEAAELAEGIEYVKRSLGIVQ